jgi:hypothetical protein
VYIYVFIYVCMNEHVVCAYLYVCMYVCMHACMTIWIAHSPYRDMSLLRVCLCVYVCRYLSMLGRMQKHA